MVYKKYVKKNGKYIGPYYYESYREGDNVKKIYLGNSLINVGRYLVFEKYKAVSLSLLLVAFILAAFSTLFIMNYSVEQPTGKVIIDVQETYWAGETISGPLKFTLKAGELIPAGSKVIVSLNGQSKEISLSELITQNKTSGNYYADGTNLFGSGEGYGVAGIKTIYPNVDFELLITKVTETPDQTSPSPTPSPEPPVETPTLTPEPAPSPEPVPTGEPAKGGEVGITGNAIVTSERTVYGTASYGKDFITALDADESAIAVPGSVKTSGQAIGDSKISFSVSDNNVKVSTDYSIRENGFGAEYSEGNGMTLEGIDLSEFGINASENGDLMIELKYNNITIASIDRSIAVSGEIANETAINETVIINQTVVNETEANLTIVNVTIINETQVNESILNGTVINKTAIKKIKISHSQIRLGERVKWIKNISLESSGEAVVEIPKGAEDIIVKKIDMEKNTEEIASASITGSVAIEIGNKESKFVSWIKKLFRITGKVTNEQSNNFIQVTLQDNATDYMVEYYTPAPQAFEENTSYGKKVIISGPDLGYTDILSYADVPERLNVGQEGKIKIKWVEQNEYVDFSASDRDGNGKIDYIEWNTPHLSNQTFEIILISKAEHLDSNRSVVEDVYDSVKSQDGNWTTIPSGDYLRVQFERALNNGKDISIYARGNGSINVYEADKNETVATFDNISSEGEYKVILSNIAGEQATFDLQSVGDIEYDYVVDPASAYTISFVAPTLASGTSTTSMTIPINVSLTNAADMNQFIWNWNGTNYTIYNDSLVLMMNLDNSSAIGENATKAVDVSKYSNNGTLVGAGAVWNSSGKYGGAINFASASDYIDLGTPSPLMITGSNPRTVEAWVYLDNYNSPGIIYFYGTYASNQMFQFYIEQSTGKLKLALHSNDNNNNVVVGTGAWHHVAVSLGGTTSKLYIDGSLVGTKSDHTTPNTQSGNARIGHDPYTGYFGGKIDEFRVYNRILSDDEIQQQYYSNLNKYASDKFAFYSNPSNLSSQTYTYQAFAIDGSGGVNLTEQRNVTITGTPVSSCQTLSSSNTVYKLTTDILNYAGGTCFTITADNITLDGQGHNIDGDDSGTDYGVYATGIKNATVKNLNISDFNYGIRFTGGTTYSTVDNNTLYSNPTAGVQVDTSSNYNTIKNNFVINNPLDGITFAVSANHNMILNNIVTGSTLYGVPLYGANVENDTFINNTAYGNLGDTLYFNSCTNIILINNTVYSNLAYRGFYLWGSSGTQIVNLQTYNNAVNILDASSGGNNHFSFSNNFGEIKWTSSTLLSNLGDTGNFTLPGNPSGLAATVVIANNSAYFNPAGHNANWNSAANITLYGLRTNFVNPKILKDGYNCQNCYNFTSLNAGTVVFNVTSWSNYTIGEDNGVAVSACGTLGTANTLYKLTIDINNYAGTCFTISADNITFDGQGHLVDGTGGSYAVYSTGTKNAVIKNLNITQWMRGIHTDTNVINFTIRDNYVSGCSSGIYPYFTYNSSIINNTVYSNTIGMNIEAGTGNLIKDNIVTTSTTSGIYVTELNDRFINNIFISNGGNGINCAGPCANTYFENNINELNQSTAAQKFYSGNAQNISSKGNLGWWPRLNSNGADASSQSATQWYNGSYGGRNSDGTTLNYSLKYWYGNQNASGQVDTGAVYVTSCSTLNAPNTVYKLTTNLMNQAGTCLTISADNITLDGQGYNVDGDDSGIDNGVYASGRTNITVKNMNISDFYHGIRFTGSTNYSTIDNNTLYSNPTYGIRVDLLSNYNTVKNNFALNNPYGIGLDGGANHNILVNNRVTGGAAGNGAIDVETSGPGGAVQNDTFINNTVYGNTGEAVYIQCTNCVLINNTIHSNSARGIYLSSASGTQIVNTQIYNNSGNNIFDYLSVSSQQFSYNNNFGEIKWTSSTLLNGGMTDAGNFTLPNNPSGLMATVVIANNSAYFNPAGHNANYNSSANVTLYILRTNLANPYIMKDGARCTNCYNFTSLNAGTVIFNVSSWSNYSIGEDFNPGISFADPTPINALNTTNTSVQINVSITNASDLNQFIWNWNGTNYTIYNDSLVLMMNFDNVSALGENGTYAVDVSKYGNNGTLNGGVTWNSSGKYGGAYQFDGINDYISIPPSQNWNLGTNDFAISFWMNYNKTGTGNDACFVNIGTAAPAFVPLYHYAHSYNYYAASFNGNDIVTIPDTWIADNIWNYITVTRISNNFSLYVNGVVKNSTIYSTNITSTGKLYLGAIFTFSGYFVNGSMDELRIYNGRGLSAGEIKQQYQSNLNKYDTDKWQFVSNQSSLMIQTYTYQAFAADAAGNANKTEQRTLNSLGNCFALGGAITQVGNYCIHTFTSNGTFTPTQNIAAEVLVVAGGGGGAGGNVAGSGGGGGAGGFRSETVFSVSAQTYNVTIGEGGPAATDGANSSFSTINARGGGAGRYNTAGNAGGSGGGGSNAGGSGGSGTAGQGNNGGAGAGASSYGSGGGGGASAVGGSASSVGASGSGGNGLASSINGSSVTYAGGGGGGSCGGYGHGSGGSGGGGSATSSDGSAGTTNTGGGGGGGHCSFGGGANGAGGPGGSGIVIIKYPKVNLIPSINFTNPTPANNTITSNTFVQINVSLALENTPENALNEFKWNWNGTNYTIYDNSLKLMFNFDNYTRLNDTSSYGNNGTVGGNAAYTSFGKYGGSYTFDGSGDYVDIGSYLNDWFPQNNYSETAWVNLSSSARCPLLGNLLNGGYGYQTYIQGDNGNAIGYIVYGTGQGASATASSIPLNQWNHVGIVSNGGNFSFYLNGVLLLTSSKLNSVSSWGGSTLSTRIGYSWTYSCNGLIDELRMWNRSLTASEVQQQYYSNLNKFNQTGWQFISNQSNLSAQNYTYQAFAKDNAGNMNQTELRSFNIIDLTAPSVSFGSQTEGSGTTKNLATNIVVNVTASDTNLANITIRLYNSTALVNEMTSTSQSYFVNFTNLPYGTYYFNASACDSAGNCNYTETRNVILMSTLVAFSLPVDVVDFGDVYVGENKVNLTGIQIQNDGNVYLNIETNYTDFFRGTHNWPGNDYMFKIGSAGFGDETTGAYNSTSLLNWTQSSPTLGGSIYNLNWSTGNNRAAIQFNITVPSDEPSGMKESIIYIIGSSV